MTRFKNRRRSRTEYSSCVDEVTLCIDAQAQATIIELNVRTGLQGKAEIILKIDGVGTERPRRCANTFAEDEEARRACTDIRLNR